MRFCLALLLGAVFTLSTPVLSPAHHVVMEPCFERWHTHAAVELLAAPGNKQAIEQHYVDLLTIAEDVCGQIATLQNVIEYDHTHYVLTETGLTDTFYHAAESLGVHPLRLVVATVYVMGIKN